MDNVYPGTIPVPQPRKRISIALLLVIVLLVLLGAGGAGFAFYQRAEIAKLQKKNSDLESKVSELQTENKRLQVFLPSADALLTARRKSRDARRIADIGQIRLALELYADAHSIKYPSTLVPLAPEFITALPLDPEGSPYSYTVNTSRDGYHLGASLEDSRNRAWEGDKDCNSITNTKCDSKSSFNKKDAFDGSDQKGCRGEADRYCYDITQ